jgi:hypothetical protein
VMSTSAPSPGPVHRSAPIATARSEGVRASVPDAQATALEPCSPDSITCYKTTLYEIVVKLRIGR